MKGHLQGVAHASGAAIVPEYGSEAAKVGSLAIPDSLVDLVARATLGACGLLWRMGSRRVYR